MTSEHVKGPIAWMARNTVAANLLMAGMLLCGVFLGISKVEQEVFPSFELDVALVQVAYPGAGPEEVEQGNGEEAVQGIDGVKKVNSKASEGKGSSGLSFRLMWTASSYWRM